MYLTYVSIKCIYSNLCQILPFLAKFENVSSELTYIWILKKKSHKKPKGPVAHLYRILLVYFPKMLKWTDSNDIDHI